MALKKSFVDDVPSFVNESIDGLVMSSGGKLMKIDAQEDSIRVVLRADYEENVKKSFKVSLISGGGSGHEPLHAGFVGEGMLTAAVCGDIFASPTIDAVLAAIRTVTGPAGCLLIVKNYTGDRLNFGLAAERARAMYGIDVKMVIVADDIALPDCSQPRGIAGTVIVEKFAGHLAEKGASLEEIYSKTSTFSQKIASIGVSLSTCNIPGVPRDTRLDGNQYELGLGIHGEAGCQKNSMENASMILERMVSLLVASSPVSNNETKQYFLLVNNLAAVTPIEMSLITGKTLSILQRVGIQVSHVSTGPAVTSLDMNGFSLSLAELCRESFEAITSPVGPSAWISPNGVKTIDEVTISIPKDSIKESLEHEGILLDSSKKEAIQKSMEALCSYETQLTKWDQEVGDGDCGQTLKKGAETILNNLDSYPDDPSLLCKFIAESIARSMGGSSGVILRLFFTAAATAIGNCSPDKSVLSAGLTAGTEAVMEYGGAGVGSRTMVDALYPAMTEAINGGNMKSIAEAAKIGAESTSDLATASHGRTQYLTGSNIVGVPDPGAMAISLVLQEIASCTKMDSS